jgi:hypothetical protein
MKHPLNDSFLCGFIEIDGDLDLDRDLEEE